MILAIETATNICSVALGSENGPIDERRTDERGSHSERLFIFMKELLNEHNISVDDLSAVVVSKGPGSYTGLRIAASGIKGVLFGRSVPFYAASTMAGIACSARTMLRPESTASIYAIIDARRVHVYHQQFDTATDRIIPQDDVKLVPIEDLAQKVREGDIIAGTGINRLSEHLREQARTLGAEAITAQSLIRLYQGAHAPGIVEEVDVAAFDPQYYASNQMPAT